MKIYDPLHTTQADFENKIKWKRNNRRSFWRPKRSEVFPSAARAPLVPGVPGDEMYSYSWGQ